MPESATPEAVPELYEILATLERCLSDLDLFGYYVAAAQLSPAIETLRAEVSAAAPGATVANTGNS